MIAMIGCANLGIAIDEALQSARAFEDAGFGGRATDFRQLAAWLMELEVCRRGGGAIMAERREMVMLSALVVVGRAENVLRRKTRKRRRRLFIRPRFVAR